MVHVNANIGGTGDPSLDTCLFAVISLFLSAHSNSQTIFQDEFNGSGLELMQWNVLEGYVTVDSGLLKISNNWNHGRIISIPEFASNGILASSSININGLYQKFGFFGNAEDEGYNYYFDSYDIEPSTGNSPFNTIHIFAHNGSQTLLAMTVPVLWGQYHKFEILRGESSVQYFIDGGQVASVNGNDLRALPVGVWNDRPTLMLTDYVQISKSLSVPEPGMLTFLGSSMFITTGYFIRRRKQ